jgi:hypothetical protein
MYSKAMTNVFAIPNQQKILLKYHADQQNIPKCGSMRLNIANVVEGSRYSFLKVIPGSFSRYSKEARFDTVEAILGDRMIDSARPNREDKASELGMEAVSTSSKNEE